ncbi:hypothetical protein WL240_09385 [Staphylococcus epidermidis]|uniref:hypothetical protein n=1 Tax=Staphylococcus epidermidis TaxID=1282 RepID=UPI0011A40E2F|nr:hypothetical protein [Staphylococcus epidermidis]MCG2389268.1 hypothetical protein [Staphylococcus epidermidis]
MKRFLALIFSSALILGACGNNDTSNNDSDTKSENKTEKKSEDKKDNKSKEDKKSKEEKKSQENKDNKSTQENNTSEEQDTQETTTNEQVQSQQQTQETATQEQQTQQANNNQQNEQRYDYDHNGVYRTPAEQRAHEQWINDQNEWNDEQQQTSQNNHVDLNSLPATDFQTDWMSKSGQEQVNDLAEQKDSGQISQYEFNDRVSDVMNNEMDNQ